MKKKVKARYDVRAKVVKAMAHTTRLFIVDELAKGPRCVCELTEMVGDDISTVSRHLSVLKNAGLVFDEKQGTSVFYSLHCRCILDFFSCLESVIKINAKEQAELAK
ncbi:MAG: metalloregulator ArsR/SmtB family transcription factor [Actinobacteria bacterium]|nr:metalloregulator ArsR/SmtB family transcription factor [Actinomycetota bacterium]